jgi:hypothetical protein
VTYITVPYQQWGSIATSIERRSHQAQTPPGTYGHPEGAATSLGTVQEHNFHTSPCDIAKDALLNLLSQSKEDKRHRYDQLCTNFVDYLDKCEQKIFMIKGFDTVKGRILNLPMSYNNRWGPARRKELSEKLDRLDFWFELQTDRPVTLATLTSYHPENESVSDSWFKLNQARGKFLKMIKKYCGNDTDYFWVPEPHPETDNGYVHYHCAIFAEIPIPLENKLRRLWADKYKVGSHTYGLDFSKKEGDDKIEHLKDYLSKYLEKGFLMKKWSIGTLIFNASLWETGFRLYGASTSIRKMMNIQDTDEKHEVYYTLEESEGFDDLGPGYLEIVQHRRGTDIVWLETRMQTVELTADNEEVQVDEIVWDRQYIPDWLDHSFWTREPDMLDWQWWYPVPDWWNWKKGTERPAVPRRDKPIDKIFRCNWGRPYKGMRIYEQNVAKLPRAPNISTQEQDRRKIQKETEEQYKEVKLTERQKRKLEQDGYL